MSNVLRARDKERRREEREARKDKQTPLMRYISKYARSLQSKDKGVINRIRHIMNWDNRVQFLPQAFRGEKVYIKNIDGLNIFVLIDAFFFYLTEPFESPSDSMTVSLSDEQKEELKEKDNEKLEKINKIHAEVNVFMLDTMIASNSVDFKKDIVVQLNNCHNAADLFDKIKRLSCGSWTKEDTVKDVGPALALIGGKSCPYAAFDHCTGSVCGKTHRCLFCLRKQKNAADDIEQNKTDVQPHLSQNCPFAGKTQKAKVKNVAQYHDKKHKDTLAQEVLKAANKNNRNKIYGNRQNDNNHNRNGNYNRNRNTRDDYYDNNRGNNNNRYDGNGNGRNYNGKQNNQRNHRNNNGRSKNRY